MGYMEIALLPKNSLRIKGKRASFVTDPVDKSSYVAGLALTQPLENLHIQPDAVAIDSPGEYEIGGIKMSASRSEGDIIYNPNVDGVEVLIGKLSAFDRMQHKLKEQHIVVAYVDSMINASFITSLASSVVILYGENARELASKFGKEGIEYTQKYTAVIDKLPQEVVTVVLE